MKRLGRPEKLHGFAVALRPQSVGESIIGEVMSTTNMDWRDVARTEPERGGKQEHREGVVARSIEQQTAKVPSDVFLWGALGSMGISLALQLTGKERQALFVGQWAPSLLILGLYNKLVKLQGSDAA
jgi:hypothetical protein